jgi:hypothetical protein
VEQLRFSNRELRELIGTLLSNSQTPPIIVLQSDEGPKPNREFDTTAPHGEKSLRAHQRIPNAYHLPNFGGEDLNRAISPVNSFRMIFNHYFGTSYEIFEDRSYAWDGPGCAHFVDVTEIVRFRPGGATTEVEH